MSRFETLKGCTVNSQRVVSIERGRVYDFGTDKNVDGFLIRVGKMEFAVDEDQAHDIASLITRELAFDQYERDLEDALARHPAGKFKKDVD